MVTAVFPDKLAELAATERERRIPTREEYGEAIARAFEKRSGYGYNFDWRRNGKYSVNGNTEARGAFDCSGQVALTSRDAMNDINQRFGYRAFRKQITDFLNRAPHSEALNKGFGKFTGRPARWMKKGEFSAEDFPIGSMIAMDHGLTKSRFDEKRKDGEDHIVIVGYKNGEPWVFESRDGKGSDNMSLNKWVEAQNRSRKLVKVNMVDSYATAEGVSPDHDIKSSVNHISERPLPPTRVDFLKEAEATAMRRPYVKFLQPSELATDLHKTFLEKGYATQETKDVQGGYINGKTIYIPHGSRMNAQWQAYSYVSHMVTQTMRDKNIDPDAAASKDFREQYITAVAAELRLKGDDRLFKTCKNIYPVVPGERDPAWMVLQNKGYFARGQKPKDGAQILSELIADRTGIEWQNLKTMTAPEVSAPAVSPPAQAPVAAPAATLGT